MNTMNKTQKYYHFIRDVSSNSSLTRVVLFLFNVANLTKIVTMCVICRNNERYLMVFIDDYILNGGPCWELTCKNYLEKNKITVGGKYLHIFLDKSMLLK